MIWDEIYAFEDGDQFTNGFGDDFEIVEIVTRDRDLLIVKMIRLSPHPNPFLMGAFQTVQLFTFDKYLAIEHLRITSKMGPDEVPL